MKARRFVITGRVQGVGFRWYTMRKARSLGLAGWVRNLRDGSVEVWAEGDPAMLDALESELSAGPPGAVVRNVASEDSSPTGSHRGFEVSF